LTFTKRNLAELLQPFGSSGRIETTAITPSPPVSMDVLDMKREPKDQTIDIPLQHISDRLERVGTTHIFNQIIGHSA
jgi:hypothetical protein